MTSVILQLICPDRPGLVSALSSWIFKNSGNIRHADHHTDEGASLFLSRLEWNLDGFQIPRDAINAEIQDLANSLGGKPYHRAWKCGVKLIGATAHYVTDELDDGPIIDQAIAHISHRDEVEDLIRKGRDIERIALARALRFHLRRQVMVYEGRTAIFA